MDEINLENERYKKMQEIKNEVLDTKSDNLPPKTISIHRSSSSTDHSLSGNTASMESDSTELFARADETNSEEIPEDCALNDSFYQKIESDKFYIDTVDEEEEKSFPSRAGDSQLEVELSRQQLMDLVEKLYLNLNNAGTALKKEKSRRSSREKTIIKLAKELSSQAGTIRRQKGNIDELKEEARVLQAEKSLVDQRLQNCLVDLHKAEGDIKKLYENQREEQLAYKGLLHSNSGTVYSPPRKAMPEQSRSQGRRVLSLESPLRTRQRKLKVKKKEARRNALQISVLGMVLVFSVFISFGYITGNTSDAVCGIKEKLWTGSRATQILPFAQSTSKVDEPHLKHVKLSKTEKEKNNEFDKRRKQMFGFWDRVLGKESKKDVA